MNFEEVEPGVQIVSLTGDFDLSHVDAAVSEFKKLDGARVAIVDLSKTDYMDSTVLGLLVKLHGRCKAREQSIYFVRPSSSLARIFQISGLDKVLTLVGSVQEALKVAQKNSA